MANIPSRDMTFDKRKAQNYANNIQSKCLWLNHKNRHTEKNLKPNKYKIYDNNSTSIDVT